MSLLLVLALFPVDSEADTTCDVTVGDDATYIETIESASSANNGYVRRIQSTGCPNYAHSTLNPNYAVHQDKDFKIQAYPCFSNSADYDVTCTGGAVGITLNGISVFSMFPGTCGSDAVALEGDTFNACSGHSSHAGEYHYHVTPSCLLDQLGDYYNVTGSLFVSIFRKQSI